MGQIKELTDTVTEGANLATAIVHRAAAEPWSRVTLMALVGALIMGSYLIYLTILVNDYEQKSDSFMAEYELLSKENKDQRALDYIQLCIDAEKSSDQNKGYYCSDAVSFYKDAFVTTPNNNVQKNIDLSAYGAMKVEMATRLRSTALQRANLNAPRMDENLKSMLNWGLWFICGLGTIAMLGTSYATYRIARSRQL